MGMFISLAPYIHISKHFTEPKTIGDIFLKTIKKQDETIQIKYHHGKR